MIYGTLKMANGETIYLESSAAGSSEGPVQASLRDSVNKGVLNLSGEIAKIGHFLEELREGLFEELADHRPNSVELEVGLNFDQTIGFIVVGSSLNAQVTLKMTWDDKNGSA